MENSCPVDVQVNVFLCADLFQLFPLLQRVNHPCVRWILSKHQCCVRIRHQTLFLSDAFLHLRWIKKPILRKQLPRQYSCEHYQIRALSINSVGVAPNDDLLARSALSEGHCKTSHGGTGEEQGSLFVESFGDSGFKENCGGIVSKYIVPDISFTHCFEHSLRSFGQNVAPKIYE